MMFSLTCAAISLFCVFAVAIAQPTPEQVGSMSCILDTTTEVMKATMTIYKKTSPVTTAYFTDPADYSTVYSGSGCQWTGTGTDSNPFRAEVEIDSRNNLPPTGKSGCGYEIVDAEAQIYKWVVYNQRQDELGREGDAVFCFECSGRGTPTSISVTVKFNTSDDEGVAVRVRPENQMYVLERPSGSTSFSQVATNGIYVGQQVKLRVQTKVKASNLRQVIDHYGVYAFYCDYRSTLNGNPTLFIELNGCGNNVFSDLAGTGFEYARFSTINAAVNERWFQTETSPFVLVPNTPANDYYYIRCYVGYCYGTEGSDSRCNNYCDNGARARRSLNNTAEIDIISTQVKVNHDANTDVNNGDNTDADIESETEEQTGLTKEYIIIFVAVSATVLFGAIVCVGLVVCRLRRNYLRSEREWTDTSTTDSRKKLSYYTDDYHRHPKF